MRKKRMITYIWLGIMGVVTLVSGICYGKRYQMQQQLAEKVLRFHVLANSNSSVDQQLKLSVRDEIGAYMNEQMKNVGSKEVCETLILEWLPEIEERAEAMIAKEGFSYSVSAELTECNFPMKTYGDYTFPAGNYEALRVTIGEGKGENWWCVMYPNMCFANSMYEVVDETSEEELRAVLDEEEYQTVLKKGNYEIRFKLLDLLR